MFDASEFLATLSHGPGVYRMQDAAERVIYVGKARNLHKRVSSYFTRANHSLKTHALMSKVTAIDVVLTATESEALILENNLIKKLQPHYNILLRDDKSFPYIHISDHAYPRLSYYRGKSKSGGKYIGPYPNASAVKNTLRHVQKIFRVRQCTDSYFKNRSRPCLQYQIKRCSAPCVSKIDAETYARDLEHTLLLLSGKNSQVLDTLVAQMQRASSQLEFERAAKLRDQIAQIKAVAESQYVSGARGDADVIACDLAARTGCVQVFVIRNGVNLGNRTFYMQVPQASDKSDVLYAFLRQFYLKHDAPKEILIDRVLADSTALQLALSEKNNKKVRISHPMRGERVRWIEMAQRNARQSLAQKMASSSHYTTQLSQLRDLLQLERIPERIECFDVSHLRGVHTVAACVVFDHTGPCKRAYRHYLIEGITPGDDYAAMQQAIFRRYKRLQQSDEPMPDILLVDGGKGQVQRAQMALAQLDLDLYVVGVAKDSTRTAGLETLIVARDERRISLDSTSAVLHCIQRIRDEAHRFAITHHRARRQKQTQRSVLEDIPGLGPKKRRNLLEHFGGLRGVQNSRTEDLTKVPGISETLARIIYDNLHT